MATNIGTVEYNLRVDMSGVRQEMAQARVALEDFNSKMGVVSGVLRNFVRGFSLATIIQAAGAAIEQVAKLGDTAKLTGVSLRQLQDLQKVASSSGVSGQDFTKGLEGFGKLLNDARREANSLSELFDANGVKINDNAGKQRSFNDLLMQASRLVQNAATEFDKIEIAKQLGFTQEWVEFLEQGPEAIRKSINEVEALGGKFDENAVRKAKEFQRAWEETITAWSEAFKRAVLEITALLDKLWQKAQPILSSLSNALQAASVMSKMEQGLAPSTADLNYLRDAKARGKDVPQDALDWASAAERQARSDFIVSEKDVSLSPRSAMPSTRDGPATKFPSKETAAAAKDTADAVERYFINLEKARDTLGAELATWGQTTVAIETAKNLEAARAAAKREGRDLTAEEEQRVRDVTAALVSQREVLESLTTFRQQMLDIAGSISNALEGWIVRGQKFKDVLAGLLQQLASMALQTALMGGNGKSGILGSLFSGIAGLFGGARAGGGSVSAGIPYVVGEQGPELFVPGRSGTIVPNGAMSAAAGGPSVTVVQTFQSGVSRSDLADLLPVMAERAKAGVLDALNRGK